MVDFRVITHDYEVHQDEKFSSMNMRKFRQFIPKGGGGTSHKLLYNHIASKRYAQNVKLLISFTDGYSDFPEKKPGIQTVFVLTRGHCPKEQMPSWANKVVVIDE